MNSLINTKWIFNDNITLGDIVGYNINFDSNGHKYVRLTVEQAMNPNKELKYYQNEDIVDYPYHSKNGWQTPEFKTIIITGGQDIKDETLVAFLQANATQETIQKSIVLEKDNIELYPRTKASLLVEDDGKTLACIKSNLIELQIQPITETTGNISPELWNLLKYNPSANISLDLSIVGFSGMAYGRPIYSQIDADDLGGEQVIVYRIQESRLGTYDIWITNNANITTYELINLGVGYDDSGKIYVSSCRLVSPNGSEYMIKVGDTGELITEKI